METLRRDLPSGSVTFLFTDVEGSTRLLHELGGEAYADALAAHRRLVRDACRAHGGVEVDTQGDAFFVAFPAAPDALEAAETIRAQLASGPMRLRIGLHTGRPLVTDEGYVGKEVHVAARIAASAHGGQIVLSQMTRALLGDGYSLVELGEHRLKDIPQPILIYQLGGGQFPPLKTISNTNLPRPASSFVGREHELSQLLARIREGQRLLTLTGPGGSGKTRLALEAATILVPDYRAGVFWVGLAPLRDHVLVSDTIARALGAKDGVADHIGDREMLLLLDNLEQVTEAAPELSTLVASCPNLALLVTSRELLRIQGEVEFAVPPLHQAQAVALFCDRAQAAPSGEITDLCRRLDNLPLAVELAAARARVLSPAQILDRLPQRLDLLKGGRDSDPRQRTLRATIEWSHELLIPEEQKLFRRLGVFAGGCTLEAAEEVCDADLDTLQSLVEKSLLRASAERYWMLETIREFAGERLEESGEADETRRRFLAFLLALAEEVEFGSRQPEWLERVEAEHENVRAELGICTPPDTKLLLAAKLGEFWIWRGYLREGRLFVEALLTAAGGAPDEIRAKGTLVAAELAIHQDDYVAAAALLDTAEELCARLGDLASLGRVFLARGWMAFLTGDLEAAPGFLEKGLRVIDSAGRADLVPRGLRMLAVVEERRGNEERARALQEQSVAAFGDLNDEVGAGFVVADIAWAALCRGDYEYAKQLAEESLVLSGGSTTAPTYPAIQHTLGLALFGLGERTQALELAQEALRAAWDQHDVVCGSALLDLLGAVAAESGADARAARLTGAAEGLLGGIGASAAELQAARDLYRPALERARERAGSTVWQTELALGAAMGFSEAVEYTLDVEA
jgi:predicted ATPase/class 3 adenylate cyclase